MTAYRSTVLRIFLRRLSLGSFSAFRSLTHEPGARWIRKTPFKAATSNPATWNGRRGPADGWLDWSRSAEEILRVVRTASKPHPGAYTFVGGEKLVVWRAELETDRPIRGAVGRVLVDDTDRGLLVQTGDGLIWLTELEGARQPNVGCRLGFVVENELARLSGRVAELERRLEELASGRRDETERRAA